MLTILQLLVNDIESLQKFVNIRTGEVKIPDARNHSTRDISETEALQEAKKQLESIYGKFSRLLQKEIER